VNAVVYFSQQQYQMNATQFSVSDESPNTALCEIRYPFIHHNTLNNHKLKITNLEALAYNVHLNPLRYAKHGP